ncbi:glycoside hydrolase family 76 protein [Paenibacillus silvisoli]|uniref:glycoside hydrolase family 76 protein n=1 Tax=Paenibacillus silvisoli TaxID=3110539 RepID=UPI002805C1B5|nr:glycoside hydrolase family 76 protein [Paenibacillus silvisoli]
MSKASPRFRKAVFSKLVTVLVAAALALAGIPAGSASANSSSAYWTLAQETHNFTVGNLLTPYNSYRTELGDPTTTEWYNVSQIYADAAMIQQGDARYLPYMNNAYGFMNHMWDSSSPIGGYFALGNVDGTGAGGDKYVDDASLAGVAYLDAYDVTTGTTKQNYLNSAMAIANWLMYSGLWDSTGGGFWWTTNKSIPGLQIKGSEVNGLACQLFLRLYMITGQAYYKSWADSIKSWMDGYMFDASAGLYSWQYELTGNSVNPVKFTYDNAIMIEVNLLYRQLTGSGAYLTAAQNLASNMMNVLWNTHNSTGAFIINTADPVFNPCYSGWASQSYIKLYEADGNSSWLNIAQQNIDTLNAKLRNAVNQGYHYSWDPATNALKDGSFHTVSQAWMQRVQMMLSQYR